MGKMKFTKETLAKEAGTLALIALGNLILAIVVMLFIIPMGFVSGGATGLGLLFEKMFGLKLSIGVAIFNVLMYIIGFIILGKRFAATTLLSTFLYPGFLAVLESMPALAEMNTDPIVAAVFGGACIGVGVGLVIRMGSSTGGMDIPPIILQKYTGIAVAISMNAMDLLIMCTQMPYSSPQKVMYSLMMLVVTTVVMDKVAMVGVTQTQVMVISSHYQEINKAIHDNIDRGTTLLNATSGHLQQDQKVVMSIINNRQLHELTQVVKDVDPHAFLIVNRINEVHGNGFTIKLDDKQRIEALKNR